VEVLVKKLTGRVNGWVSYTYSRSLLRVQDPLSTELINDGEFYPSNYDKPHDFTFIGNYRFNKRVSFSLNMTYSTGRPITLPLGKFELGGAKRVFYSERNQYRIRDYYRTDFSLNVEGNHRVRKLSHSSWTFAVYNLTGRKNPYSVFFRTENGAIKGLRTFHLRPAHPDHYVQFPVLDGRRYFRPQTQPPPCYTSFYPSSAWPGQWRSRGCRPCC
jgi:hypothetical protein